MAPILRVVVDVLKPHDPPTEEFTRRVADADGVAGVNLVLLETDQEVQNVKLTVEGEDVDYGDLTERVRDLGATVHSIDQMVAGDRLVEEATTPQD